MKIIIISISALVLIVIILLILKNVSIENELDEALKKLPEICFKTSGELVTENILTELPEPLQKYFRKRGMLDQPLYNNAILYFNGDFKMAVDKPWIKVKTVQFNSLIEPLRIFIIRADIMGLFSMVGADTYHNGTGQMRGELMRVITIFDESGEAFNISELTTYLNDAFLMFPWTVIHLKDRFIWETIDTSLVRFRFTDQGMTVGAELHFDEEGFLTNYITDDRYLNRDQSDPQKYVQTRWSTPVSEYKNFNGQLIPTFGQAIWHYDNMEYCYAKFRVTNIQFDVKK